MSRRTAILVWGVVWLKELSVTRHQRVWRVHFPQTGGLAAADEVQVNGIRRGDVQKVDLVPDGVIVNLVLSSDLQLTRDCDVSIRNVGMMGEKVIAVTLRSTGDPYTERDTIRGVYEMGLPEVAAGLGGTVGSIATLATQLESVASTLSEDGNFTETLKNFRAASEDLRRMAADSRTSLKTITADLGATARTARTLTADREAELKRALDHFASSAEKLDRLSGRLDSLRASLQSVSGKLDRGQGTLGKLVNDDRMYDETRAAIGELKALIADIKANPKKYLTVKIF
jgi:phospholipid/cholesterol/gamma-HCH transport system substrate-binding protein